MTSHHDVAVKLRELARDCVKMEDLHDAAFFNGAAEALEHQAKALSEAEAERDAARDSAAEFGMLAFKWMERHDRIAAGKDGGEYPSPVDVPNVLARALAAEARLAEATGILEFYAEPFEYIKKHGLEERAPDFYDELNTGERAQDFLRAQQESKDA